jgi:hypothetical protein
MAKLHEILAVEAGLAETANRVKKETTKTLGTKHSIFEGLVKSHVVFAEENQYLVQAPDIKEVQTTVDDQLNFMGSELARYWDASLQKEEANQRAKAQIIIDDKPIGPELPAIVLLSMEKKLESLLAVYNAIPTLDASKAWEADNTYAIPGVFRTKHSSERQQTITVKDWIEVSPATREHKAQIVQSEKTEVLGKYITDEFSGSLTSLDKAERIQRLTKLIRAVKTARQRANGTEVNNKLEFGLELLSYVNGK